MSNAFKVLNYTDHGHLKIKPSRAFPQVKNEQIVPVIVHEFSVVGAEMPIVFVKNNETGEFQSVALLGFKENENVFLSKETWQGTYVPAVITHYPFALMPVEGDEYQFQIAINESSSAINESEGEALFDESGKETPYMDKRKQTLGQYYENSTVTHAFTAFLNEKGLFTPQSLTLDFNGEKLTINGLYLIDEQKLRDLSNDDYLTLRERGYIGPIYSHLQSIHQLHNLARIKSAS